ncbi:Fe-S cluster assembly protein SufD [Geothrix sp. PMB-07]|uniref:Fe-S cluster assembly protein SufD n=1 Tax=Geothrix sp. PMB-07 TaxID=3068640 RepID=UPI00274271AB|nr:Fe-S cluster assembly protein SufD [Geothrix sp. PMB-07]WLT32408.1 Fe-S cluster assembly protein SufD [Geothrix sp. PMB-07]
MTSAVGCNLLADLLSGPRPAEWGKLREEAEARLEGGELPTSADEDWKYLDLKSLSALSFGAAPKATADISGHLLPEMVGTRQVFVNGHHAPHASCTSALPAGLRFLPLSTASEACHALGTVGATDPKSLFEDLNAARFEDGAVILVPKNMKVALPLHLLFITQAPAPVAVFPRLLVILERGSELELIEEHHGEGTYLTAPVIEIRVAEGAILRHERVQRDSMDAFHLGTLRAEVAKGGQYHSRTLSFGARLSRQQPWLRLAEGVEATLDGLALLDGQQVADTHSFIHHAEPHAQSHQLHKCIVDGKARAIFNGQIRVAPGAQGTDAKQQSRNLLLSEAARVDTKPQLEIYADDVKCSHGAAVGQLDPEELFYMQSRGLNADDARNLLTYGFAADVITHVPVASLRRALRQLVMARTQAASLGDLS